MRTLPAIASLTCLLVAGCVNIGPSVQNTLAGPSAAQKVKVLFPAWHRALVIGTERTYSPFEGSGPVADPSRGRVYVGTSTGRFVALRSQDGNAVWTFDAGESIHSAPALDSEGKVVYFGDEAGSVYALDTASGKQLWRYGATAEIRCKPLVHEQIIIVKDVRGKVHAIDGRKGTGLWLYRAEPPEGYLIGARNNVALVSGHVLTGFSDGTAVSLKLLDGSKAWETDLAEFLPGDLGMGSEKYDVNTTPVPIDADHVLFSSYNGGLFALDPASGSIQWRRSDLDRVSGFAVAGETIFVARSSDGIIALDLEGDTLWQSHFPCGSLSDPVAYKGRVYVTDSKSGLVVLDGDTGRVLDRYSPAWGGSSKPHVVSGRAFLFTNGGHLFTFLIDKTSAS
jgi:outer membrane protein assembly factor BamB